MSGLDILDLKTFVPAKDFAVSRRFYADLGFIENWVSDEGQIAELRVGAFRFLLQNYYLKEFAENCMMHLMVKDADAWWKHICDTKLIEKYPGTMARPPAVQPWGLRILYVHDPAGVLWHIADNRIGS